MYTVYSIDTQEAIRDYVRDHPHYNPLKDPSVMNNDPVFAEVSTVMMQVSQEKNSSTLMVGVTGTAGDVGIARGDVFFASDTQGNSAWMYDSGGGGSFPPVPFASGGVFISATNATSIDKLTGLGAATGGTIGALGVFGISVEVDKIPDLKSNRTYTGLSLEISFTFSPSPVAGYVYSTVTNTKYFGKR